MTGPRQKTKPILPTKDEVRRVAMDALLAVARDKAAPAQARAGAARTLLESIGDIGRLQEVARISDKSQTELSIGEIDEEIARLKPML